MKRGEEGNIIKHDYQYSNLNDWFDAFSLKLHTPLENNRIELPKDFGNGFMQVGEIENGLTYRLANYSLNQDFEINFNASPNFCLFIHLHKYISASTSKIVLAVGDSLIENEEPALKMSCINTSRVSLKRVVTKGTFIKGMTIQLSEDWLVNNIKEVNPKNYEKILNTGELINVITAKQEKIFNEIFEYSNSHIPSVFISSRILRLLEIFLESLLNEKSPTSFLTSSDIEALMKVESILLEDYKNAFPKISSLARIAGISESKLKKIFKKTFGTGIFEYYQRNRMHKAKELLLSGKHTISEIGNILGYANLSNFSSSFKKEFKILPKEFVELHD